MNPTINPTMNLIMNPTMNLAKKITSSIVLLAIACSFSATSIHAEEIVVDNGGGGYDESVRTTSLAPAIALGAIALVGIIAVAVQNTSGHSHCHAH